MTTRISPRQIASRDVLQQIFPYLSGKKLDELLKSIDKDLQVPLRVDASSSPDLTITIGPSVVNNTTSGRQKSIPHINNLIPMFTSGSIVFPATDGGTIVVTPGADLTLVCPLNEFVKILISLDSSGQLVVTQGTSDVAEASALVPAPVANCLPIAYVSLFNNGGTIDNVTQNKIFQFGAGGGTGGAVQTGFADTQAIPLGATSVTINFPSALPGVNYVPQIGFVNETDPNPQFQDWMVTNKSVSGFTVSWNAPTDSSNYSITYIVPAVQEQLGEKDVPMGATSLVVPLAQDLTGVNYSVVPGWINEADPNPQFQALMVTARTATTFTVSWNSPTDSANYRISFRAAVYQ